MTSTCSLAARTPPPMIFVLSPRIPIPNASACGGFSSLLVCGEFHLFLIGITAFEICTFICLIRNLQSHLELPAAFSFLHLPQNKKKMSNPNERKMLNLEEVLLPTHELYIFLVKKRMTSLAYFKD